MLKRFLHERGEPMTDATMIYRELLAREMRGPADREAAMHRLQARYGLDFWTQWGLRYRPPKRVTADLMSRIRGAYLSMLEQSVRRDVETLKIEAAKGTDDADLQGLAAQAENLLAEIEAAKAAKKGGLK